MRNNALAFLFMLASGVSWAQGTSGYPVRPVRFISISAPGSGGDALVRLFADKMASVLHGTFIVENHPGAGGSIAVNLAAKAVPDGYTITIGGATTHVLLPAADPKLPYDSVKDFEYIGQIGTASIVLVARKDFPANNLKELVDLDRAQPGLQYASWGTGSTGHFCGALLNQKTGARLEHIPYKSVAQIQTDLYGGHIQLGFVDMASAVPMVKAGGAKAIALCLSPSASFPNVQSYKEDGITDAGQQDSAFRWAIYAPAGTPASIRQKLSDSLEKVVSMPDVAAKLTDMGITAAFLPGSKLKEMTQREIVVWRQVAKDAAITME